MTMTPNQQLFAALKAEDGTSPTAVSQATKAAEERWPMLKSLAPKKWPIAPVLSDLEKQNRSKLEPVEIVARKPAASAPNMNEQIANALLRMAPLKKPTVAPETVAINASPSTPEVSPVASMPSVPPSDQNDASIISVLQRIERAHEPVVSPPNKVPSFLSRLGKR